MGSVVGAHRATRYQGTFGYRDERLVLKDFKTSSASNVEPEISNLYETCDAATVAASANLLGDIKSKPFGSMKVSEDIYYRFDEVLPPEKP